MKIQEFFDKDTCTLTYVVYQEGSNECIIIDPVLDFDQASGKIAETSVHEVLAFLVSQNLTPTMSLETHAHADHLSGAQIFKKHYPKMTVAISGRIAAVQKVFTKIFNIDAPVDGSQFDYLFQDHQETTVAGLSIKEIPTPGHTPACSSYLIGDAVFTGDALFMPDYGVGRCDFPAGSAEDLYNSVIQNLYTLPAETRVFTGHDYQPGGRKLMFESTIKEQRENNIFLNASMTKSDFVERRQARDSKLSAPKLLLPSIQINILAGHLPEPDNNGVRYLRTPLQTVS